MRRGCALMVVAHFCLKKIIIISKKILCFLCVFFFFNSVKLTFPPPLVPPSIVPFSFAEEPVNTGESAGVQCMIQKGDVPITIKWTLNSRPIINGEEGLAILKLSPKSSVLNIAAVEEQHRGLFKCIAENKAGADYFGAELKVNGIKYDVVLLESCLLFVVFTFYFIFFIPLSNTIT